MSMETVWGNPHPIFCVRTEGSLKSLPICCVSRQGLRKSLPHLPQEGLGKSSLTLLGKYRGFREILTKSVVLHSGGAVEKKREDRFR